MASASTSTMASASTSTMPSSLFDDSPRKAPPVRPPRDGEHTDISEYRKTIIGQMRHNVKLCEADSWVEQYAEDKIVQHVFDALVEKNLYTLGDDKRKKKGWVPLQIAKKQGLDENATFDHLGAIAIAIAIAAKEYYPDLELLSAAVPSPRDKTWLEVNGYTFYSDWRTVLRFATKALPLPEKRRTSTRLRKQNDPNPFANWGEYSKAGADTAMMGEFKLHNTAKDRADVSIAYCVLSV